MDADHALWPILAGAALLFWALLARRSRADAGILGTGGLLLLIVGLRPLMLRSPDMMLVPMLVATLLGLVLLIWSFFTRLRGHRIGYRLVGCGLLVPIMLFALLVFLFSLDNHHVPE